MRPIGELRLPAGSPAGNTSDEADRRPVTTGRHVFFSVERPDRDSRHANGVVALFPGAARSGFQWQRAVFVIVARSVRRTRSQYYVTVSTKTSGTQPFFYLVIVTKYLSVSKTVPPITGSRPRTAVWQSCCD